MHEVTIIGIDLAKNSFQLHGARADGSVAFRKKLGRDRLMTFLAEQPHCIVAMEACATAHGWGREIADLGHAVKLIPPHNMSRRMSKGRKMTQLMTESDRRGRISADHALRRD